MPRARPRAPGVALTPAPRGAVPAFSADAIAARLVASFFAGRNARTVEAYGRDLEDFRAFTGAASVQAAADHLLSLGHGGANACALAYRAALVGRGLSPATVNRRLAAVRSLVKLARTVGVVPWSLEVPAVKSQRYRDTRGPGRAGFVRLVASLDARRDPKGLRDRAVCRLLYDTALRRGEVVALDVADVELAAAAASVSVLGKGRTERERVTLPAETRAAVAAWLAVRGTAPGPLFRSMDRAGQGSGRLSTTSVYRIVRQLGDRVGIRARPHGLRHAAITDALDGSGGNLRGVAKFSRHRDLRTLERYDDNRTDLAGSIASLVAGRAVAGQGDA